MLHSVWAVVHNGKIQLAEQMDLPEGAKLVVTILPDEESRFWMAVTDKSLSGVWDNLEDDVYAKLLEE